MQHLPFTTLFPFSTKTYHIRRHSLYRFSHALNPICMSRPHTGEPNHSVNHNDNAGATNNNYMATIILFSSCGLNLGYMSRTLRMYVFVRICTARTIHGALQISGGTNANTRGTLELASGRPAFGQCLHIALSHFNNGPQNQTQALLHPK